MMNILTFLSAFIAMEAVAWFTHKFIMHGILWRLHRDHHTNENKGFLQHNDFFFLLFAIPGIASLLLGISQGYNNWFWAGLGITFYGAAYFIVHDLFIHQRLKVFRNTSNFYLKAIRKAHKMHHKHLGKEDGECFGMLWIPMRYFKKQDTATKQ